VNGATNIYNIAYPEAIIYQLKFTRIEIGKPY
jgi:hypothetical protein